MRALRPLHVRRRRRRRGGGVGAAAAGAVGGGRGDVHVLRALRVLPRPAARRRRPGRRRRAVRVPVAAGVRRALGRHRRAPARPALPLPLPAATLRRRRRLPRDDAPGGRRRRPVVPLRQRRPASRPPPRTEGTAGVGEFQHVVACVVYTPRGLHGAHMHTMLPTDATRYVDVCSSATNISCISVQELDAPSAESAYVSHKVVALKRQARFERLIVSAVAQRKASGGSTERHLLGLVLA